MRRYGENGRLERVICNGCAKRLIVKDGIVREGCIAIRHSWDYFSEKDGERHAFDLCENCYDEFVSGFHIEVSREEEGFS